MTVRQISLVFVSIVAFSFALCVYLWHVGVANAGPAAGAPGTPDDPVSLNSVLNHLIQVTAVAAVAWVGHHLTTWLRHSSAGKKAAKAIDDFQLEQLVADRAINYVEEQAHKALKAGSKALDGNAKLKAAVDYAKAHGIVDDGLHRVEKIVEARLNASRPKVPAHGLIGAEA